MTLAERIVEYTQAAIRTGLPVREVIVQKGQVRIIFGDQRAPDGTNGLNKNWAPR